MAYDLSIYTKLFAQAGNSSSNLQAKFPFICDLPTLTRAITGHPIVTDARQNPNGYDAGTMAYKIIEWFDKHADYPTGKKPSVMSKGNALKWSQPTFWYLDGLYEISADPGYKIYSYDSGVGDFYEAATLAVDPPVSGYPNPTQAQMSHVLQNYGPIDYITGDAALDVPTISSDDLYVIYFDKTTTTDYTAVDGTTATYYSIYPAYKPQSQAEDYSGINARKNGVTVPPGCLNTFNLLYNYSPTMETFRDCASLMFKADVGISNKSNSLAAGGVAPTYSIVTPGSSGYINAFSILQANRRATVQWRDFSGAVLDLTGKEIIGIAQYQSNTFVSDIDIEPRNLTRHCKAYGSAPIDLRFSHDASAVYVSTQTTARGTSDYMFRGYPVYALKIKWQNPGDPGSLTTSTVYAGFNHLTTWSMNLYNSFPILNTTGLNVIGNATFKAGFAPGTAIQGSYTGVQTTVASVVTLTNAGSGYTTAAPIVNVIAPGAWGRYHSSRVGVGQGFTGRIDEWDLETPVSGSPIGVTVTSMSKIDRSLTTVFHGHFSYAENTKNFQKPWFGVDNAYENNSNFGCAVTLDAGNRVTGLNGTITDTSSNKGAAPGVVYETSYYHSANNVNGFLWAYSGAWGQANTENNSFTGDYLDNPKFFNRSIAVYTVQITDGRVTGFTPIVRQDGDGANVSNGWDYYDFQNNQQLGFERNNAVSLPANAVIPKAYYTINGAASNGINKKISVSTGHPDFFAGVNLPSDAFTYAIAYRGLGYAPSLNLQNYGNLDSNDIYSAGSRQVFPDFYPSSIKITSERPLLRSTTRSLIDNVRSTGAQRYSFVYTYPPMYKDEAQDLVSAFEKFRSGEKAFQIRLPNKGFKLMNETVWNNYPNYATYLQIGSGAVGSTELKIDGVPPDTAAVFTAGTYFKINGDPKLYQIVEDANSNYYGETVLKIEPGLKQNNDFATIYTANTPYIWITVRFADDALSYATDGSGLYALELAFVEALG